MRTTKVIHRKEAYLGAIEAKVTFKAPGKETETIYYDDLDKLERDWRVERDDLLVRDDGQIAQIEIKVYYQSGRGAKQDTYRSLPVFKRHWESKNKYFTWER